MTLIRIVALLRRILLLIWVIALPLRRILRIVVPQIRILRWIYAVAGWCRLILLLVHVTVWIGDPVSIPVISTLAARRGHGRLTVKIRGIVRIAGIIGVARTVSIAAAKADVDTAASSVRSVIGAPAVEIMAAKSPFSPCKASLG